MARFATALLVVLVVALASGGAAEQQTNGTARRRVLVWLCLERCGFNSAQIAAQLKQLQQHADIFSAVSFPMFELGPNSTLVGTPRLSNPLPHIQAMGFESYALIAYVASAALKRCCK
jgi:hypothetical protein